MSTEVGSAHLSIFPVMTGFKARVAKEARAAGSSGAKSIEGGFKGSGARAGRTLGRDMKSAMSSAAGDLGAVQMKTLTGNIASASSALARARLKQQDDAGKVRVAEAKLAEAVAKYGPASSQAIAAEERLASARRTDAISTGLVVVATERLRDAQDALSRAQAGVAQSSAKASGGLRSMAARFREGFTNANAAKSSFSGLAGSIGGLSRALLDVTGFTALGRLARAGAMQAASAFTSLATMIGGQLARAATAARVWAVGVGSTIRGALAPFTQYAAAAGTILASPFIRLGSKVADYLRPVTSQVSALFSKIAAVAGPAASRVVSAFGRGLSGIGSAAASALSSVVSAAGRVGQAAGRALASGLKAASTTAVTVAAAGIGIAFTKGLGRLGAIDTARAKLTGLGNDSKTVKAVMSDALASVKGTAFGLGEAATVAAGAMAAQIKPGQALQTHLKNIANNAAAAGVSMEEMGSIFNKAATQANGVQNDVIGQLADKGIPIYQELAKQLGVTSGEVFKMASDGKINFETFQKAATAAAGTVAQEMGKTVPGAAKNFMASLGRIGANALEGIYGKIGPLIQAATNALGPIEERAKAFGDVLMRVLGPALDWVTNLLNRIGDAGGIAAAGLGGMTSLLAPVAAGFAALGAGGLGGLLTKLPVVGSMLGGLAGPLAALGGPLGIAAAAMAGFVLSGGNVESLVSGITSVVSKIVAALPALAQKVATFVPQLLQSILSQVPKLLQAGVQIVNTLIQGIVTAVPILVQGALTLITGLVQAIITNLPAIIQGALALVNGLVTGLITAIPLLITAAVQIVTALIGGIVQMLPQIVQGGLTLLTGLLTAVVKAIPLIINGLLQLLPKVLTTLLGMLPQLLQTGITLFVGLVQALVKVIPQLIQTVLGLLPKILNTLIGMLPKLLETGVKLFIQLVQAVVEVLPKLLTQIIQMLPKIISTVISMLPKLLEAAVQLFLALVEAIPKVLPELVKALIDLAPKLVAAIIEMVPKLLEAGKDLIRGLIEGIASMGKALFDAIGNLMGGAVNFAKDLLGIASPSKVFIQIGKYVGQGFIKGVTGTKDQVTAAMGTLIEKVKSSFDKVTEERKKALDKQASLEKKYAQLTTKINDAKSIKNDTTRARRLRDLRAQRADVGKEIEAQKKLVKQYNSTINKGKTERNLLADIRDARTDLKDIAKERASVLKDLDSARADLKSLRDARGEVIGGIRDAVVNRGDITAAESLTDAIANLENQLAATTRFEETLRKLKGLGLDDTSRDQLVNAFKQSGTSAMADQLLAGGADAVKRFGQLQSQLADAAQSLGKYVGDDMYKAGIDAATGLIEGLKSQAADLADAAKTIADELVAQIKKSLKIKSPSRVTRKLGNQTGEGLQLGLRDEARDVQRAADAMLPDFDTAARARRVAGQLFPAQQQTQMSTTTAPAESGDTYNFYGQYAMTPEEIGRTLDRKTRQQYYRSGALLKVG